MLGVTDTEFADIISEALSTLPRDRVERLKNVAILYEHEPTPEQRRLLSLRHDQTLFGLYEGVPLTKRQGMSTFLPDKITLFKGPLCAQSRTMDDLKRGVRHTLWHEIAHYFGLDHAQIAQLDGG